MQRTLLASQLQHPTSPMQNMALLSRLHGPIDPERLAKSFEVVVDGNDVLRTRITDGRSSIVLGTVADLPTTEIVDLPVAQVDAWATARAATPLDLRVAGYDSAIAVHEDGTVSWYLNLHHVVTDATSSALVFAATAAAYDGESSQDRPGSYYRWARSVERSLADQGDVRVTKAIDHWGRRAAAPRLGRLYEAVSTPTPAASRHRLHLDGQLLGRAEDRLGGDYRMLTPDLAWSTLLVTATALFLHRVAGGTRFSIGLPVHNRRDATNRELIGPTMEVFPVDVEIELDDTHRSLHKRVSRAVMRTLQHAVPGTAPTSDGEAVVNVIARAEQQHFGTTPATTRWVHAGAIDSSHLLRVQYTGYAPDGDPDDRELAIDLNDGACGPDHRALAPGHFTTILAGLVDHPDDAIGAASICGDEELATIAAWERTEDFATATELLLPRLRAALSTRSASGRSGPAIEQGDRTVDGDELLAWVDRTAAWLTGLGVGPGSRVAIGLPRSIEAVVAILATMTAGGSFVPIDPTQPEARRSRLIERAGCAVTIDDPATVAASRAGADDRPQAIGPDRAPRGDDEAYLLFTSGSTGEPKGVPITHAGIARYLRFAEASYLDAGPPVAALFSPLTFDLTMTSLFLPLLSGGRLVVIEEEGPTGLTAIAARPELTWLKATPSHLEILIRLVPADHGLTTLVVGGEAFSTKLASAVTAALGDVEIFNEYGPTEAVVGCMHYRYEPELASTQAEVPIGRPAPGVTLRVVDEHGRRVPIGSPGELCIASPGLTAGYLADDETQTTAETQPSPFFEVDGQRFYRSGDLVRLQDPTRLTYLGRRDEQIKVGGVRLEPAEVEAAIEAHPAIEQAAVRLWAPKPTPPRHHCVRCGLPDNVPGMTFDGDGVCRTCHDYDRVAPVADGWFRSPVDLADELAAARAAATGDYDCVHLLSGGKDSTYALYQLVEQGFRPYAFTLDNGFISDEALANVERSVADLGIDNEIATTASMNEIFRDSLERHSNVCNGCYKTIYTLATTRAVELGAPLIVTGLSRGQLFETRLIPQQFAADRFDPDAIDRAVVEARRVYHAVDDGPNRLLDTAVFEDDTIFDRIRYVDFYRYVDVELAEMFDFLDRRAPWVRPSDTGRSTNCLINAAGIHTHQTEHGYHNYAVPYAWDVRLGHKTRDEAIAELDDQLDLGEVGRMLDTIGYQPAAREVLTAWAIPAGGAELPSPAELRSFLGERIPGHAIPAAFVEVEALPLSANGKLDNDALPPPGRIHRPVQAMPGVLNGDAPVDRSTLTDTERTIIDVWERTLRVEPITPDDDFFAIGGDSLAALEMVVALSEVLDLNLTEDLAFINTTPRSLGAVIDVLDGGELDGGLLDGGDAPTGAGSPLDHRTPPGSAPAHSVGELAVLYEQGQRPDDVMYNVGRIYRVDGAIDGPRFETALRVVAARHQPLRWTAGAERRLLPPDEAIAVTIAADEVDDEELQARAAALHRTPFDLTGGPLLRTLIQPVTGGSTAVVFAIHHASGDAESFGRLWRQIDGELTGSPVAAPEVDYAGFCAWQAARDGDADRAYWLAASGETPPARLAVQPPATAEPDGFLTTTASAPAERLRTGSASAAAFALAALSDALADYSDGPEVELGLITSTRNDPAAEDLIGYFLNTVPVRIGTGEGSTLSGATAALAGAVAHRSYPLASIVADRRQHGAPAPNVDVMMAIDSLEDLTLDGMRTEQGVLWNGCAVAPLTFFVEVRDERIDLSLEYRGSVIGAETAAGLLAALDRRLADVLGVPAADAERAPVARSVAVGPPLADDTPVAVRIAANLASGGARPAVRCGDATMSWDGLAARAAALAQRLSERGVEPGDRVIVALPRSADLVAAIVAVHLSGATYVPIDPTYPPDRIALLVDRAAARVGFVTGAAADLVLDPIVTSSTPADQSPDDQRPGGPRTAVTGPFASVAEAPWLTDGTPAYVIFTSGSTGQPRGVPVDHTRLAASTNARTVFYDEAPSAFLLLSSAAFDSSIVGLFWTLAEGGTVVLPTEAEAHDLPAIVELATQEISHTLLVPTLYRGLLDAESRSGAGRDPRPGAASRWPHVIVAGEACPPALVARHRARFGTSPLTNEYGPTEATVWATAHRCDDGEDPVPIGRPIAGAWVAVVDRAGRARPEGVAGELIIGGAGVVDGYLDDRAGTEARFADVTADQLDPGPGHRAADRIVSGGPAFLTGDLAVMVDGVVRYLGRTDNQLNVGGARAEPEEIEAAIVAHPDVSAAIVVAADLRSLDELLDTLPRPTIAASMASAATSDDPAGALTRALQAEGEPLTTLVAHVEGPDDLDLAAVRALASSTLAPLLRPARYVISHRLPRTPNGKLDRAAAERLPITGPQADGNPGRDVADGADRDPAILATMTRLFADALRNEAIGPDDSFFDNGGHSLLAMELLLDMEKALDRRLPAALLYDHPTPRAIAAAVGRSSSASGATPETATRTGTSFLVPIQPNGTKPPMFAVHVLGVDCAFFRPLAARLGDDQPMYGLGQPTMDLDTAGPTGVAEVAEAYRAEIDRVAPTGPISLAAISLGGVVAYELAQQLVEAGRDVELLTLFDAFGPGAMADRPQLLTRAKAHGRRLTADPRRYIGEQARHQSDRFHRVAERAQLAVRNRLDVRSDHRLEVRRFIEENVEAQTAYRYDPYPGRMLVVKAGDDPFAAHHVEAGMGWRTVAVGGLAITTAPGGHLSMMAEPNVQSTAAAVEAHLDDQPPSTEQLSTEPTSAAGMTERLLIGGLRSGQLPATVDRLIRAAATGRPLADDPDSDSLLGQVDHLLTTMATASEEVAAAVAGRLLAAGVDAEVLPVPTRVTSPAAAIRIAGSPASSAPLAVAVMAAGDYQPTDGSGPAAIEAVIRTTGRLDFVPRGSSQVRIRLEWPGAGPRPTQGRLGTIARRALTPNRADYRAVDVPSWAWPVYWAVRPGRLMAERVGLALPLSGEASTDLGIFLGTPPALIPPLLDAAGVRPGMRVVDLGCGDGRVLIEAAKRGCEAIGYETDRDLVWRADGAAIDADVTDRVTIVQADASTADLSGIDVVFVFLPAEVTARILPDLLDRLDQGATLVAHEQLDTRFPIAPDEQRLVLGSSDVDPSLGGITVANLWRR